MPGRRTVKEGNCPQGTVCLGLSLGELSVIEQSSLGNIRQSIFIYIILKHVYCTKYYIQGISTKSCYTAKMLPLDFI